jgi:Ca2+-binding RTX toxin-like protein
MRKQTRASRTSLKRISSGGVVLALVALFGLPAAPASAAGTQTQVELNVAGTTLTATAFTGAQINSITVGNTGPVAGGGISIKDTGPSGDGVFAGPNALAAGCTDSVNDQVRCPFGAITSVVVFAGPSNDNVFVLNDDVPTTANGGTGNDALRGGAAADIFHGNEGTDSLVGGAGGDVLDGGPEFVGPSATYAGDKDDADYGSSAEAVNVSLDDAANDGIIDVDSGTIGNQSEGDNVMNVLIVEGSSQADILTGDTVLPIVGATLVGNNGNDDLNGGPGNDTLKGLGGGDDFDGAGGIDTVSYGNESEDVIVNLDNLPNDGPAGENDNVRDTVETVIGGIGDDTLTGAALAQTLNGGGGNDTINGDLGNDTIQGGTGTDTVSYAGRTNPVTVSLDGVAGDGEAGESDNIATDVENILGGSGNDNLTGSAGRNRIDGGLGGDLMNGADGDDTIVGSVGVGDANDDVRGGAGTDTVTYAGASAGANVTLDNTANDNGQTDNVRSTIENVTGSPLGDTIVGSAARNRLNGGLGNDTLDGDPQVTPCAVAVCYATSNDTLNGGGDNDTLFGRNGSDTLIGGPGFDPDPVNAPNWLTDADDLDGGAGSDLVSYSTRNAPVTVTIGAGANDGEATEGDNVEGSVERVTGGKKADTLTGNAGLDRINGGNGGDIIDGGSGGDILSGQGGDDDIKGGTGKDTMSGAAGDDSFRAQDGVKDSITCGDGNDTIINKDAVDVLSANCVP